jgi:hypothetical protein
VLIGSQLAKPVRGIIQIEEGVARERWKNRHIKEKEENTERFA